MIRPSCCQLELRSRFITARDSSTALPSKPLVERGNIKCFKNINFREKNLPFWRSGAIQHTAGLGTGWRQRFSSQDPGSAAAFGTFV